MDKTLVYLCYLIHLDEKFTYIGVTNNFTRRLRQHNNEIKGGAKYTTNLIKQKKNTVWKAWVTVEQFPSYQTALQFEWMWKYLSRKLINKQPLSPIQRRLNALDQLLKREKATSNSQIRISDMNLSIQWHEKLSEESQTNLITLESTDLDNKNVEVVSHLQSVKDHQHQSGVIEMGLIAEDVISITPEFGNQAVDNLPPNSNQPLKSIN